MPERPDTWIAVVSIPSMTGERTGIQVLCRGTKEQCEQARARHRDEVRFVHPLTGETATPNRGRVDIVHADDWVRPQ